MDGDKVTSVDQVPETLDVDATLLQVRTGVSSIEQLLNVVIGEMKDLRLNSNNLQKLLTKKESKVRKTAKPKLDDSDLVTSVISALSAEKVFTDKFTDHNNLTLARITKALEYDMFFKTSDCNTVKIFSNDKFTHNNYLRFSVLDVYGFSRLQTRFYSACDEYKTRYINDLIHNISISKFNYKDIEQHLTEDFANNVSDSKIRAVFSSFQPINSEYNRVPVVTKDALSKLTDTEIESHDLPNDDEYVCISYKTLGRLLVLTIKAIKDLKKRLFFTYLPHRYLKQLHDNSRHMIPSFPSLKTIASKISGMDDVYVVLTADVDKMVSLLKKRVKQYKLMLSSGEELDTVCKEVEVIHKESGEVSVSEKKFLNELNDACERTLDLFIKFNYTSNTSSNDSD